jgi:hypothetical protein
LLTTDPLYWKPLLPVITIKNTANNTTLYTYNSFTDSGVIDKPIFCSVALSQNTHGEFGIQFEDENFSMKDAGIRVGSRVLIECGKSSTGLTRLISGLVRKQGYSRGGDRKVLFNLAGSSTGIRLNERVVNQVNEAARFPTGAINFSDSTRLADTLLASSLGFLTSDGILSIANLAANSDVETFIASLAIEFGEAQDLVNYIEDQSGGEVIIDVNDLINFRHELKTNMVGRGFTIKNKYMTVSGAQDNADDTMYLRGKDWSFEDSFYKSDVYANRIWGILPAGEAIDVAINTWDKYNVLSNDGPVSARNQDYEWASEFRPTHTHFVPGDIYVAAYQHYDEKQPISTATITSVWPDNNATILSNLRSGYNGLDPSGGLPYVWRIAGPDNGNHDPSGLPVVANVSFDAANFPFTGSLFSDTALFNQQSFFDSSGVGIQSFNLDTTKDYWLVLSSFNSTIPPTSSGNDEFCYWLTRANTSVTNYYRASPASTQSSLETSWTASPNTRIRYFEMPILRAHAFNMWDPKAVQAVSQGLSSGLYTDSVLSDASAVVKTKEAMARHLSQQLYSMSRPRTTYSFPRVTAPNIPIFPGDPIVISDSVLGFTKSGNRVTLTTCGDMFYQWGEFGRGDYQAPTELNIQAIGIHGRYN